jgi:hypothetical protein
MTSLTIAGIPISKPYGRRTDRSKKMLDKQTRDPARTAITKAVIPIMTEAWTSRETIATTIEVPGGHILNGLKVAAAREGTKIHVWVMEVSLCEKLRKRSIRMGDQLVMALKKIASDKHMKVNPKHLEGSIKHDAEVFAKTVMGKVYEMEKHNPDREHGKRRKKEKQSVERDLRELTGDGDRCVQIATSVEATKVDVIATKTKRQLKPSRRQLVQV